MKTTWLQIRLSHEEKSALRALAAESGDDLSTFVLRKALAGSTGAFGALVLGIAHDPRGALSLAELGDYLLSLPAARAHELGTAPQALWDLDPLAQNLIAAMVEHRCALWEIPPPRWTAKIPSLEAPYFAGGMLSLRVHLLVRAPVPYRRRNLFVESGLGSRLTAPTPKATAHELAAALEAYGAVESPFPRARLGEERHTWGRTLGLDASRIRALLTALDAELARAHVIGEVHLVGGAVMTLVYSARESTQDVDAAFAPEQEIRAAVARIAQREALPEDWLNDAVLGFLAPRGTFESYLDLPHLRVYVASAEYLFALKCLATRIDPLSHDLEDIRFLARYLGLKRAGEGMSIVLRYFDSSRIMPKTMFVLEEILGKDSE